MGDKAVDRAAELLAAAGFAVDAKTKRRAGGVVVTAVATDPLGREWLVDVVGGFTIGRPGLRRTDVLERTLGRAARLTDFGARPLLVFATDVPPARTPGGKALAAARGRVLVDVLPVDLPVGSPTGGDGTGSDGDEDPVVVRLRAYAASAAAADGVRPIGDLIAPD